MNSQIKTAFLLMIIMQAIHSVEEFIFKLYDVFPPMQFIYRQAPSLAKPAFVAFNLLLILCGLVCFFYWVRPAREGAKGVIWVWVVIQLATVAGHVIWVALSGGYHPGLATVGLFIPVVAYVMYAMRRASSRPPPNKSLERTRIQRVFYLL